MGSPERASPFQGFKEEDCPLKQLNLFEFFYNKYFELYHSQHKLYYTQLLQQQHFQEHLKEHLKLEIFIHKG